MQKAKGKSDLNLSRKSAPNGRAERLSRVPCPESLVRCPESRVPNPLSLIPILSVLLLLCLTLPAIARDFPPNVPPPKPIVIPNPTIQTLPNGLQVVVVERHTLPLITLRLVVKSGAECDPPNLPGTAMLVNGLLNEGTEHRTSREIAEAIDSVGGLIDNDVDWDASYLSLSVLTDRANLAFDRSEEHTSELQSL